MDFALTKDEKSLTTTITNAAYDSWVLVNDYFSWEKELLNFKANGSVGEIVSAVFLFMKWYSVDAKEGKRMLRAEIQIREHKYCQAKADLLARGNLTENTKDWLELLDLVTAGNFAWSMTTARYLNGEDAYPGLRAKQQKRKDFESTDSLNEPISYVVTNDVRAGSVETNKQLKGWNATSTSQETITSVTTPKPLISSSLGHKAEKGKAEMCLALSGSSLSTYEDVSNQFFQKACFDDESPNVESFSGSPRTPRIHRILAIEGDQKFRD